VNNRSLFPILAIAIAAIMVFAAATPLMSAQTVCGNGTVQPLGNVNQYAFKGDEWNSSQTQCMSVTNNTGTPPSGPSFTMTEASFSD